MNVLLVLFAELLRAFCILSRPGDNKALIAQNLLLKQQLLVLNRSRKRAPNLNPTHRLLLGFWCHFLNQRQIKRSSITFRPSTLFRIHNFLIRKKYRVLFSPKSSRKPGPKGLSMEVIEAIIEFKCRNPRCGRTDR